MTCGARCAAPLGAGRAWQRQSAALEQRCAARRTSAVPALTVRAGRADRMVKGRLAGDAWDEMALLAADICGRPLTRSLRVVLKAGRPQA